LGIIKAFVLKQGIAILVRWFKNLSNRSWCWH